MCPIIKGRYLEYKKLKSVRRQNGCASIRSGISGATGPDFGGYAFSIIVRIASIGNSYN